MEVAARVLARRWGGIREMQYEVDGEAEEDQRQEGLVLVVLAVEAHVRERGEQGAVNEGADGEPEERAAVCISTEVILQDNTGKAHSRW